MNDLICQNTMMRCQNPGMCSPHGGCRKVEPVSSVWLERLRGEYRAVVVERDQLKAEIEALRKDAERYLFLRNDMTEDQAIFMYGDSDVVSSHYLDEAVDGFIKKGNQP